MPVVVTAPPVPKGSTGSSSVAKPSAGMQLDPSSPVKLYCVGYRPAVSSPAKTRLKNSILFELQLPEQASVAVSGLSFGEPGGTMLGRLCPPL